VRNCTCHGTRVLIIGSLSFSHIYQIPLQIQHTYLSTLKICLEFLKYEGQLPFTEDPILSMDKPLEIKVCCYRFVDDGYIARPVESSMN